MWGTPRQLHCRRLMGLVLTVRTEIELGIRDQDRLIMETARDTTADAAARHEVTSAPGTTATIIHPDVGTRTLDDSVFTMKTNATMRIVPACPTTTMTARRPDPQHLAYDMMAATDQELETGVAIAAEIVTVIPKSDHETALDHPTVRPVAEEIEMSVRGAIATGPVDR